VRFDALGMSPDLDDAIGFGLMAVEAGPNLSHQFECYSNLAWAMAIRHQHSGDATDLDQALTYHRRAVESAPAESPNRALALSNLCLTLLSRYEVSDSLDDLGNALEAGEQAIAIDIPTRTARGMFLANLSFAYALRFDAADSRTDLDRAIELSQEALLLTPVDHPLRARRLFGAGNALRGRSALTGDPADLTTGLELLHEAMMSRTSVVRDRINAAVAYGAVAADAGRWREAADALRHGVELLPLVALRGIERADAERLITDWQGLARDAAACAINAGDHLGALAVLEGGRAVLWSQQLDMRSDLSLLRASHPVPADELAAISAELSRPSDPAAGERGTTGFTLARIDRMVRHAHRWDALVKEIRSLPGFESFLAPVPAETILATLPVTPAVILNVSRWRCDAIIVRGSGVTVRPLPCTFDDVVDCANAYVNVFVEYEERPAHVPTRLKVEQVVEATLDWLWENIAAPVLDELGHREEPAPGEPWPQVWWCPTGPLTVLPIHAAGRSGDTAESALSRVVSSYTPTLRALHHADTARTADERLLVVGVSQPAGLDLESLDNVEAEINQLAELLPPEKIEILDGPSATRLAIPARLRNRTFVHLSCHGSQDLMNPSHASILAHDGPLTLVDITTSQHSGELITLSACMTATGGAEATDEVVSLAAGMQYSGWRQVVATLWWVWDDASSNIMTGLYRRIIVDGVINPRLAAQGLHEAVRDERARYPHQPTRWAPFVHIGT
jgi:hypothetical protein